MPWTKPTPSALFNRVNELEANLLDVVRPAIAEPREALTERLVERANVRGRQRLAPQLVYERRVFAGHCALASVWRLEEPVGQPWKMA